MKTATATMKRVGLLNADFPKPGHNLPQKTLPRPVATGGGRQIDYRTVSGRRNAALFTLVDALAGLLLLASAARAAEAPRFVVEAIARQESSGGKVASSDRGRSVGHCMMQAGAWADVNKLRAARRARCYPFACATVPEINREYAGEYFADLGKRLARALKRPATVEETYAAYNQGFAKFAARGFSLAKSPPASRKASAKVARSVRDAERAELDARFAALAAKGRQLCGR